MEYSLIDIAIAIAAAGFTALLIASIVIIVYLSLMPPPQVGQDISKMKPVRYFLRIAGVDGDRQTILKLLRDLDPAAGLKGAMYLERQIPVTLFTGLTKGQVDTYMKIIDEYKKLMTVDVEVGIDA